jgi:hypothetical protein
MEFQQAAAAEGVTSQSLDVMRPRQKATKIALAALVVAAVLAFWTWELHPRWLANRIQGKDELWTRGEVLAFLGRPHRQQHSNWYYEWEYTRPELSLAKGLHWKDTSIWVRVELWEGDETHLRSKAINTYERFLGEPH